MNCDVSCHGLPFMHSLTNSDISNHAKFTSRSCTMDKILWDSWGSILAFSAMCTLQHTSIYFEGRMWDNGN